MYDDEDMRDARGGLSLLVTHDITNYIAGMVAGNTLPVYFGHYDVRTIDRQQVWGVKFYNNTFTL